MGSPGTYIAIRVCHMASIYFICTGQVAVFMSIDMHTTTTPAVFVYLLVKPHHPLVLRTRRSSLGQDGGGTSGCQVLIAQWNVIIMWHHSTYFHKKEFSQRFSQSSRSLISVANGLTTKMNDKLWNRRTSSGIQLQCKDFPLPVWRFPPTKCKISSSCLGPKLSIAHPDHYFGKHSLRLHRAPTSSILTRLHMQLPQQIMWCKRHN